MLLRPDGATTPDSARWDTCPERMTYFLELLAKEKREGRFLQGNPNNTHYNLLIRSFWDKFKVYHTKPQFKNHFTAKKQLWNLLCWAQNCTGISWDEQRKRVIASPEWWDANKERRGLSAIRDKCIPDYDLLELVFRGQHAEGAYMRDPNIPRFPRAEVVGDSEPLEISSSGHNAEIRRSNTEPKGPRKKKRNDKVTDMNSSPIVENINCIMENWFDKMQESRLRRQESKTVEMLAPGSLQGVVRVLLGEMKMDVTSHIFQLAQDLFEKNDFLRVVLMEQEPGTRWTWLINTLGHRMPGSTPFQAPLQAPFQAPVHDANVEGREG